MVSFKSYYFFQASIVIVLLFMIMHMTPSFARLHMNKVSNKENQVINDICSKTTNPSNCLRLLKSISGTSTADLKGIAKIVLDLARSNATKTLDLINTLIPKTHDFRLKEGYRTCSEVYDNATDEINNAKSDFIQGDYSGMNEQASGAMTEAVTCDNETQGLPIDPSVRKGNQDLQNLCEIILVIANLLKGSN
ncbi:hypothetical protein Ddye_022421 [Dipteronia dyeriana]|uniref:Pectinesterase inhibitor domain-containing protein n=1 Tax=Dipteronia dyeriana TaxID=168575 RepID=A0AAD9U463_9ROSI|nr:hypothetical protein Ddye_022421 [Dipteronia dyeriana]